MMLVDDRTVSLHLTRIKLIPYSWEHLFYWIVTDRRLAFAEYQITKRAPTKHNPMNPMTVTTGFLV